MRPNQTAGLDPNFSRFAARRGAPLRQRTARSTRGLVVGGQAMTNRTVALVLDRRAERATAVPAGRKGASEAIARRLLVAIRVAMGLVFVACGLSGFIDFTPTPSAHMHQGAMAFGGALLVAGSLLPLLKGTEVIVETVLELQRALGARRVADRT